MITLVTKNGELGIMTRATFYDFDLPYGNNVPWGYKNKESALFNAQPVYRDPMFVSLNSVRDGTQFKEGLVTCEYPTELLKPVKGLEYFTVVKRVEGYGKPEFITREHTDEFGVTQEITDINLPIKVTKGYTVYCIPFNMLVTSNEMTLPVAKAFAKDLDAMAKRVIDPRHNHTSKEEFNGLYKNTISKEAVQLYKKYK